MNILVVEREAVRRAELVDAICELPGIVVRGATEDSLESRSVFAADSIDTIVVGNVSQADLAYLRLMTQNQGACSMIVATTAPELAGALRDLIRLRGHPRPGFQLLAARSKYLAFERDSRQAGPLALAHHLRIAQPDAHTHALRGTKTLDLREWLPLTISRMRAVIPDYVEIVALVAADTPEVRCMPDVLEHVVLDLVLEACTALPWGGTIWITAEPDSAGQVRLDLVENGGGQIMDLTLRASEAPCS